jgi:hypothetical protein
MKRCKDTLYCVSTMFQCASSSENDVNVYIIVRNLLDYFQRTITTEIAILMISLNPQDSSSVRLPIQSVTYAQTGYRHTSSCFTHVSCCLLQDKRAKPRGKRRQQYKEGRRRLALRVKQRKMRKDGGSMILQNGNIYLPSCTS